LGNRLGQNFLFAIKLNRRIDLSKYNKINGKFPKIKDLNIKAGTSHQIFLKGYNKPFRLILYVKG
jgi:hypothetical protein